MYVLVCKGDRCNCQFVWWSVTSGQIPFIISPRRLDTLQAEAQAKVELQSLKQGRGLKSSAYTLLLCEVKDSFLIRYILEWQVHTQVLEQRQHLHYLQILQLGGQTDMPASTEATRNTPLREETGNHFHTGGNQIRNKRVRQAIHYKPAASILQD